MAKCLSFSSSTFLCPPSTSLQRPLSKSSSILHSWSRQKQQKRPLTLSIRAEAVTIPVITFDGENAGTASLDIKTARPETARAVVHRGVVTELQNRRRGTASTLTRGEVRGGGRKPYKQKGSGKARRGSQRTPLRPGGGVIFGPKPKDWSIKINKKEKRLAISTALSSAAVDSVVIDSFNEKFDTPKTKNFVAALKNWGVEPSEDHALIFTTELSEKVRLSSRNIGSLKILTPRTLNLYDILRADKLIFTKDGVEYLNKMYGLKSAIREGDEDEDEDEGGEEGEEEEEQSEEEESSETPETAQ
ncbi:large ribosomal subunit protein uL4c isoform X1 [Cryptomeria japonica]|uniref:large ribosomal subunit protein uL4c isoform X1 n=1 Tax=Cryptomeria japonica TaxID=3369 RepID=UPI0025ACA9C5|nr:large ribosomal subunit protein uL4c isoform X1 [Cryptomeria japonica]